MDKKNKISPDKESADENSADKISPHKKTPYIDSDDNWSQTVVSASECTGLIFNPTEDEYEVESYTDIYNIPLSIDEKNGKPKNKK